MSKDQWKPVDEQKDEGKANRFTPLKAREGDPTGQFSMPLDATTIAPGETKQGRTVKAKTTDVEP